jgi:hypothetical protein
MHPFPPESFDWRGWLCPAIFFVPMFSVAALLMRPKVSHSARIIGFGLIGAASVWFLMMLPTFQGAREAAPRTQCKNNLKWIAMSVHEYYDEYDSFPAPTMASAESPPTSWRVDLIPRFDPGLQPDPTTGYDRSVAWDDPANLAVSQRRAPPYFCPTNDTPQDSAGRWYTAYTFLTGPGTVFPSEGPLKIREIMDGTSQTLMLVEACGAKIVWTQPADIDVSRETAQINAPGKASGTSDGVLSSYHEAGAHCALADGSVRYLNESVSPDVVRALTTAAAEDVPGEF